jgi:hypothetical protein
VSRYGSVAAKMAEVDDKVEKSSTGWRASQLRTGKGHKVAPYICECWGRLDLGRRFCFLETALEVIKIGGLFPFFEIIKVVPKCALIIFYIVCFFSHSAP